MRIRNRIAASLLAIATLASSSWPVFEASAQSANSGPAAAGRLLITGSSTMAPMVRDIADRFQALRPGVRIEVEMGGSGRGIGDAMAGKADIGMASRALTGDEVGLSSFAVARDGLCLIVHADNPVQGLSKKQVLDIYTGSVTNWREVGGRDAPIIVMAAADGYSSTELFTQFFKLKSADIRAHKVLGNNAGRIEALAADPNGIVYVSVGEGERRASAGAPIKLLSVDHEIATRKNVRSGNSSIARPLLLLTRELPSGSAKEFIDFALSSKVADIVERHNFVPYVD